MPNRKISGLLIDIDGVLVIGNQRINGSLEALEFLKYKNIPYLLVTNTTRRSRVTIWHHLKRLGLPIREDEILTAPMAAVNWLKGKGVKEIALMLSGSAVNDFKEFKITAADPQYIVIGDLGKDLTFEKLNSAFRLLMRGAKILALQKNRYWQTPDGLTLDAGAIVAALEYAARKRATIVGKPRKEFFQQALDVLNLPAEEAAMIGDDLEADIDGAQKAGLAGISVKTGKFRQDVLENSTVKPDAILNSIADLPNYIEKRGGKQA